MTSNQIIPFSFENQSVRVIESDGEPWFVLADVCKVLEIGNPSQAAPMSKRSLPGRPAGQPLAK